MATLTKQDLHFKDYSWKATEGDSAKITGFPDNILLNRKEGYEVLHFINRFIDSQHSWQSETTEMKKQLGYKIEKIIHDHLPGDIRSHAKVRDWIISNWKSY
jgi:hypothetical protein